MLKQRELEPRMPKTPVQQGSGPCSVVLNAQVRAINHTQDKDKQCLLLLALRRPSQQTALSGTELPTPVSIRMTLLCKSQKQSAKAGPPRAREGP